MERREDTGADLPYRPCVGVMLVNGDGHVLAGQRLDSPSPAWQMPQGGIDEGEDPQTAAYRELWEETGVVRELTELLAQTDDWVTYDLPEELLGRVWGGKYRGQKQKWYLMRFLGTDDQIDITLPPREFSAWKWLPADQLAGQIVPFKRAVYETVVAAFKPHL